MQKFSEICRRCLAVCIDQDVRPQHYLVGHVLIARVVVSTTFSLLSFAEGQRDQDWLCFQGIKTLWGR